MDQFPGVTRQRRAHISGRRRDRSAFVKNKSAGQSSHRSFVIRRPVRSCVGLRAIRSWLAASSGPNRGHCAFDDISGGCFFSNDRGGVQRYGDGQMILAACFISPFVNVLAFCGLFASYNLWLLIFVVALLIVLWFMPRWTNAIINKFGATRVSEPEVKFIFFVLFFLGGLATTAKSEAVLPAYLVGLVVAGIFLRDKTLVHRMRSIAFAIFTPFYFIKAGLYVSLPALWPAVAIITGLLLLKMLTKTVGVWPLARTHFMDRREASYTTLLMATGLTFGTISALFGLHNHIINQRQYTILVTVVILSAFVPTLIAQKFFQPTKHAMHAWGRRYSYGLGVLSVEDADTEVENGLDSVERADYHA